MEVDVLKIMKKLEEKVDWLKRTIDEGNIEFGEYDLKILINDLKIFFEEVRNAEQKTD